MYICAVVLDLEGAKANTSRILVLHQGTEAECQRVYDLVPAVCYSGPEKVLDAHIVVAPKDEFIREEQ